MFRPAALVLFLAAASPAVAQTQTVLEFLNGGDLSTLNTEDEFAAQNYVTGVVDASLAAGTAVTGAGNGHAKTCLPPHIIQATLEAVVIQYIASHPDALQFPAAADVTLALTQAYPCG